jgi:molybdopterin converting factor subunit 1
MTVTVKLFAAVRDLTGTDETHVTLPDRATVGDLRRELGLLMPLARTLIARSGVAVNHDVVDNDRPLTAADEVAVIPPVSGG